MNQEVAPSLHRKAKASLLLSKVQVDVIAVPPKTSHGRGTMGRAAWRS